MACQTCIISESLPSLCGCYHTLHTFVGTNGLHNCCWDAFPSGVVPGYSNCDQGISRTTSMVDKSTQLDYRQAFSVTVPHSSGDHRCQSDWMGAHFNRAWVHVRWSPLERTVHINLLELLAVIKVFLSFQTMLVGKGIQVTTDNTTTLHYINKQGGTHSLTLLYLTVHLWEWCYANHIYPCSHFHSGKSSRRPPEQDTVSQSRVALELWNIPIPTVCHKWGTPILDIFATPENAKYTQFCTRAGICVSSMHKCDLMCSWGLGHGSSCISFVQYPHSEDNNQDASRQLQRHYHRTLVAMSAMVRHPAKHVYRLSTFFSSPIPANTEQQASFPSSCPVPAHNGTDNITNLDLVL